MIDYLLKEKENNTLLYSTLMDFSPFREYNSIFDNINFLHDIKTH